MPETARSPPTRGPYSLREYAFLADGERGALMGPRGEIAWLCFPGWADEALFSSLLLGPGRYDLSLVEPHVWGGFYEPRSLIWRKPQGDRSQAVRWFDRARTACGPSGLLTEEFDVAQRQLRGNLPQAFVHALLLETSLRLGPDGDSASGEGGGRGA